MLSTITQKLIVGFITLSLLVFLGYTMYNKAPVPIENVEISLDTEAAGQEIIALTEKLKVVSIDHMTQQNTNISYKNEYDRALYCRIRLKCFDTIHEVVPHKLHIVTF